MSDEDAKAFITQVAPLGTMDYSLLHKRPPMIDTSYGFSLPVLRGIFPLQPESVYREYVESS